MRVARMADTDVRVDDDDDDDKEEDNDCNAVT